MVWVGGWERVGLNAWEGKDGAGGMPIDLRPPTTFGAGPRTYLRGRYAR